MNNFLKNIVGYINASNIQAFTGMLFVYMYKAVNFPSNKDKPLMDGAAKTDTTKHKEDNAVNLYDARYEIIMARALSDIRNAKNDDASPSPTLLVGDVKGKNPRDKDPVR